MTVGRGATARAVAERAALRATDLVVDVGCGPGTAVREAGRRGTPAIGIDRNLEMVRLAGRVTRLTHSNGAHFIEGSAESLPLVAGGATVLWALSSVHHWQDLARGLAEALRVLAPQGRLLLVERSVAPGAKGHARHGLTDEEADRLVQAVEAAGFTRVARYAQRAGRRNIVIVTATAPAP
jgi:ubiquinone/menaquinone biosynthesis C-methylase UbiE